MGRLSRLAALGALVLLVVGCSGGEPADYDAEFRDDFLSRCTDAFARPGAEQVCGCWYDAVSGTVAYEDLPDLADLLGGDFDSAATRQPGGDLDVPLRTLATCVRTLGAETTLGDPAPPPTEPRRPTPTTTATTVIS